ncbi:MAG TPA: hypothetical protein VF178_06055 [Gemmatimonadaceae bacterium]
MLTKEYPDHYDAELVLRLYDLRRDALLRDARRTISAEYWPRNADEAVAVLKSDHPLNAAFRQVITYWEMAYGMVKWGVLHGEFMMESSGEGLMIYARAEPYVKEIRAQGNPNHFVNAEWVANNVEAGRKAMERYRARVQRVLASR